MPSLISRAIESVVSAKEKLMSDRSRGQTANTLNSSISHPSTKNSSIDNTIEITSENTAHPPRQRITWKKVLYHPLTWLAVGLHVALLVVPFSPASPVAVEPEEESTEENAIPIDLLNLSEIATSTPPADTPPPSEAAPPAAAPPDPSAKIAQMPPEPNTVDLNTVDLNSIDPKTTEPNATESKTLSEGPAQSPTEASPTEASPADSVSNDPPFDPGPQSGVFIQGLGNLGVADNSNLGMPLQSSFRRPENYSYFVAGPDQAAPGARGAKWLDDERNDLVPLIQNTYAAQSLTLIEAGAYGGEALYELQSAEGNSVMFVSIVELEGSSLLVLWNNNPTAG